MTRIDRARGCLAGQLAGDALGSLVEFREADDIRHQYPDGVTDLADGGTFDTVAGQPTDDSEMALALARTLVEHGRFDTDAAYAAHVDWIDSEPFDCGGTVHAALDGQPSPDSQANGAMMRASVLGIAGAGLPVGTVTAWAMADAALTHVNPVCVQANALYVLAIAEAVHEGSDAQALYATMLQRTADDGIDPTLRGAVERAAHERPEDHPDRRGWVLFAFQEALWQLLHEDNLERAVIDVVMRGGDTDTNAAICGALLGAVHGIDAVPVRWTDTVLACRPEAGRPGVRQPRPERFWPTGAMDLAERLLAIG